VERAARCDISEKDVVVDYTGGTKVMSTALLLTTVGRAYRFNYVGGDSRSKNGLGALQDGHEKMYADLNPWSVFAEEERRQIVTLFNARHYTAFLQILDICKQLPAQIDAFFQSIRQLANGFLFWEKFLHGEALDCLKKGSEQLDFYIKHYPDGNCALLREELQSHIDYLADLLTKTNGMQIYRPILIKELVNNARRRMMEEFRVIIADTLALFLFNLKILQKDDFYEEKPDEDADEVVGKRGAKADVSRDPIGWISGNEAYSVSFDIPEQRMEDTPISPRPLGKYPVKLQPEAFQLVIEAFERKLTTEFYYPPAERTLTYWGAFIHQAGHCRKVIQGEAK